MKMRFTLLNNGIAALIGMTLFVSCHTADPKNAMGKRPNNRQDCSQDGSVTKNAAPVLRFFGTLGMKIDGELSPFMAPSAISVKGNYVFIVDSGLEKVFKYDRASRVLKSFIDYPTGFVSDVLITDDMFIYIVSSSENSVNRYDINGRLERRFRSDEYLAFPFAIVADKYSGIYVADGQYNHILEFNTIGSLIRMINYWTKDSNIIRNISAMAIDSQILYIADKFEHCIHALDLKGKYLFTFGCNDLDEPVALAVDRFGRVFVVDRLSNSIKVFSSKKLVSTYRKNGGVGLGRFMGISDIAINEGYMYVADEERGDVQMAIIIPEKRTETACGASKQ